MLPICCHHSMTGFASWSGQSVLFILQRQWQSLEKMPQDASPSVAASWVSETLPLLIYKVKTLTGNECPPILSRRHSHRAENTSMHAQAHEPGSTVWDSHPADLLMVPTWPYVCCRVNRPELEQCFLYLQHWKSVCFFTRLVPFLPH